MGKYRITNPDTGLSLVVQAERAPDDADAAEIFANYKKSGQDALNSIYVKWDEDGKKRDKQSKLEFISKNAEKSLGIPAGSFDASRGLGMKERALLDLLPNEDERVAKLQEWYGEDNVSVVSLNAKPKIVYKDPKDGKTRFVDEYGVSMADVTSDIAGAVYPTVASTAAGLAVLGIAGTAPVSLPLMGAAALAGGAAYMGAGVQQDVAARAAMDMPIQPVETLSRRGVEAAIQVPIDLALMRTGKWVTGLIGKEGKDLVTAELKAVSDINAPIPPAMMRGEKAAAQAIELAEKSPTSQLAERIQTSKERMAENASMFFKDPSGSMEESYGRLVREITEDYKTISGAVESAAERKATATAAVREAKVATTAAEKQARAEAKQEFDGMLQRKIGDMAVVDNFSPEASGMILKQRTLDNFIQTERVSNELYRTAMVGMRGINTTFGDFAEALRKGAGAAAYPADVEGEIISTISPRIVTQAGKVAERLDEIADESMSFEQVNEALKIIRSRVPYGGKGILPPDATPEQRVFARIAKEIDDNVRKPLLNQAPRNVRQAFDNAETFYKEKVLPFNLARTEGILKLEPGENLKAAFERVARGEAPGDIRFAGGGTEAISAALQNPKAARDAIRMAGNSSAVRRELRNAWLNRKGITANSPLTAESVRFSAEDLDMARTLWDTKKVAALQRLQQFAASKDVVVDGLSAQKFNALVNAQYDDALKAAEKAAKDELAAKAREKEFLANKIIKMIAKGDAPAPRHAEEWVDTLLTKDLKTADIEEFIKRLPASGRIALRNSSFEKLLQWAGQGEDFAQVTRQGLSLWDGKKMNDLLKQYETRLRAMWGDRKYDRFFELNRGFTRLSTKRPVKPVAGDTPRANLATSIGGGISFFLTGIPRWVKNKIITAAWGSDIWAIESMVRGFPDEATYEKAVAAWIKTLFVSQQGIEALLQEAERSPAFTKWLNEQMELQPSMPLNEEAALNSSNAAP